MFKILILGGDGLLAHALKKTGTADFDLIFRAHRDFDLTDAAQMLQQLAVVNPQIIINTAAYNLVERCEQERDISWAVNANGPEALAKICAEKAYPENSENAEAPAHYGDDSCPLYHTAFCQ